MTLSAVPPGPIEVTYEWSTRSAESPGPGALTDLGWSTNEQEVRAMIARRPGYVLMRRTRWTALGPWEDVL